jgi:hypothetical protein
LQVVGTFCSKELAQKEELSGIQTKPSKKKVKIRAWQKCQPQKIKSDQASPARHFLVDGPRSTS